MSGNSCNRLIGCDTADTLTRGITLNGCIL